LAGPQHAAEASRYEIEKYFEEFRFAEAKLGEELNAEKRHLGESDEPGFWYQGKRDSLHYNSWL
jgi:hypothetical protein